MSTIQQTLRTWTRTEVVPDPRMRTVLGIVGFVVATALASYVAIPLPFTPVPITLQPLVVLLAGALLGPWAGAGAMAAYLAVGAAGAPVFSSGHAGLPWLMGFTGGYLIAYPAAAFLTGWLMGGREARLPRAALALAAGLATIYAGGVAQLLILTGNDLPAVLAAGVFPFVAGDLVKLAAALGVLRLARTTRPGSP